MQFMIAMSFSGKGNRTGGAAGAVAVGGAQPAQAEPGANPRMGSLLAEIYRTGSLSAQSLASVTRNPQEFTQDELRRLISAVGAAGARFATQQSAGNHLYATGGAVVAAAWR
jgi:hypothetical protein